MQEDWVRLLRDQCVAAGVPFCYKQQMVNGVRIRSPRLDGKVWDAMPTLTPMPLAATPAANLQLTMFDEAGSLSSDAAVG